MGQRADEIGGSYTAGDDTGINAKTGNDSGDREPEEIRAEIEQTRAEMSGTIDAIQEKLNPDNLKEQAKEMVRDATVGRAEQMVSEVGQTAKGFGSNMMDTIKQNPLPAALAGIGLGWLFMKSRDNQSTSRPYRDRANYGYPDYLGYRDRNYYADRDRGYSQSPKEKVGDAVGQVGDKVGQVGDKVGEAASTARDSIGDMAEGARDRVGDIAGGAQHTAVEATDSFERLLRENPLVVGAGAAILGAAVGLMIPETEQEHRVMGQARDNLMDKAQEAVQTTVDKVQRVAEEAGNAVQREAEAQGMTQP